MGEHTLFVGLDVHKRTITVATAPDTSGTSCTFYGTIINTPDAPRRLCNKLAATGTELHFCYEAGPCGYVVQRRLWPPRASLRRGRADPDPAQGR